MTLWSWPLRLSEVGALLLTMGREATNGVVMPAPKVVPLPALIFIPFRTLARARVNFIITTPQGSQVCFTLCLVRKLACHQTTFGSVAIPTHDTATAMHFPANAGLIFLTDELTNDRYLVDTGATLSIVPGSQNSSPSGPLLKGAEGQPIPSWGFIQKTTISRQIFHIQFLASCWAGPILGIDFLRKLKVTVVPEINKIQFACTAVALPAPYLPSAASPAPSLLSAASSASSLLPTSTLVPAPVQIQLPAATTSSQPPPISAHVVWNPKVKSSRFSSWENQSLLDPPPSLQKIPDSVPAHVKALLQTFLSILRTGDVKPTPTHGVEHHIHNSSHPPVFTKSHCLDPEKLQITKAEFKRLESAGIIHRSKSP
jgi:hypothetical protein